MVNFGCLIWLVFVQEKFLIFSSSFHSHICAPAPEINTPPPFFPALFLSSDESFIWSKDPPIEEIAPPLTNAWFISRCAPTTSREEVASMWIAPPFPNALQAVSHWIWNALNAEHSLQRIKILIEKKLSYALQEKNYTLYLRSNQMECVTQIAEIACCSPLHNLEVCMPLMIQKQQPPLHCKSCPHKAMMGQLQHC